VTLWRQSLHRPQGLWLRRALFQIHLWTGIAAGLYIFAISLSGSAIVFRRELLTRRTVDAEGRPRLGTEELRALLAPKFPDYEIVTIIDPESPSRPDTAILQRGDARIQRLLDPYTGVDLGDPRPALDRALRWLTDLHDNLLAGLTGRIVNGLGALLVTVLAATGAIVWWPGAKNWRRALAINPKARFARLNWDLHSAVGFWCSIFVVIWGVSGILLCLPGSLHFFLGPDLRAWLTRLHFGRFNAATEALWTLVGLAPALLATTGAIMWWNRVLSKKLRRRTVSAPLLK